MPRYQLFNSCRREGGEDLADFISVNLRLGDSGLDLPFGCLIQPFLYDILWSFHFERL